MSEATRRRRDRSGRGLNLPAPGIGIVVASSGRPDHLAALLDRLANQTRPPDIVVLSVVTPTDAPDRAPPHARFRVEICTGPQGLTAQRNRGLDRLRGDTGIVAFLDDDYLPALDALDGMVRAFDAFPQANGLTGRLLADGIHGTGLAIKTALALLWDHENGPPPGPPRLLSRVEGLYGCNMAVRVSALGALRFDERLPLYGWQEDIDFTSRIPGGKFVTDAFTGVHCGTKQGRERQGLRLGYSQIANPFYLRRKGTMSRTLALRHMVRNVLANHVRALRPEPWIDRKGRASGNRIALFDMLTGRIAPERILDL
ncbi:glycosyltransferase family A protein [uncultured Jannaschia sp.]|uniref:glycosyltransferase family 2 protein n=1 Tax=uncultured Jannaschia sp. TaxID=293347 RepID=UPI002615B72D|nr:glycosyltransferase family A protein [uncultured Jannaschia sp.]